MINTFYHSTSLSSATALLAALVIGLFFGFALERAGFGSSRRLTGIFYFRDMAVLKVMFTGLIVAMLGVCYCRGFGLLSSENIYFPVTRYWAQILGGLLFGVGFVMGGWCPGTAAVGLGSGRLDALIFLVGTIFGSLAYNETYGLVKPLVTKPANTVFIYETLGMGRGAFALLFTIIAITSFHGAEFIEYVVSNKGKYLNSPFLKRFSFVLLLLSFGLLAFDAASEQRASANRNPRGSSLLKFIQNGGEHIEARQLAQLAMKKDSGLLLVDIRPANEYARFHLRGAVNIRMENLESSLAQERDKKLIVLYSNGQTHPAQACAALLRQGFWNVKFLTNGLRGFIDECLKPASLRKEPLEEIESRKIDQWRRFFLANYSS